MDRSASQVCCQTVGWIKRSASVLATLVVLLGVNAGAFAQGVNGACCRPDGSCFQTNLVSECEANGGTFIAGGICTQGSCRGVCCKPDGTCFGTSSENECKAVGGTFFVGQSCAQAPCPTANPGACCVPGALCFTVTTATQCNGTYFPNSSCQPNPCVTGSCCTAAAGCVANVLQSQCNGTFTPGNTCVPNPCNPTVTGACCLPNGTCQQLAYDPCKVAGGLYQGNGTSCTQANICLGACCRPGAQCVLTTAAACAQAQGTFAGIGVLCIPDPCNSACCLPNGQCVSTNAAGCAQLGGIFNQGVACSPTFACPQQGACCDPATGNCVFVTQQNCVSTAGIPLIWLGLGTTCANNPCRGACCANGNCFVTIGANECASVGGVYYFNTPCSQVGCDPKGACCTNDGQCLLTTEALCCGVWLGVNTSCSPNPCFTGACCNKLTGQCSTMLAIQCKKIGGGFIPNATCSPNPCPKGLGACCMGATCVLSTQANCPAPKRWLGAGTICFPAGSAVNPCCPADFNNSGTRDVADIFAFLAYWFGGCP